LDTRDGTGGAGGLVGAGATRSVQITGRGGVPSSGARAVILNATVTGTGAAGYLTVFPSGTSRPTASDLNFAAGDTRANLVVAKLSSGGQLTIFSSAATHVIFDVAGWIS
ncbi:MAG: choice-of-anchor D domain-containing protein, partial [Acidimicrobiales bacterium]